MASLALAAVCMLPLACGGRATQSDATTDTEGGEAGAADGCVETPAAGCAGSSGLAGSVGLHSACGNVTVDRKGVPVPICHHIR